jgi:hypothetical protein
MSKSQLELKQTKGPEEQTICHDAKADVVSVMSLKKQVSHTLQHAQGTERKPMLSISKSRTEREIAQHHEKHIRRSDL